MTISIDNQAVPSAEERTRLFQAHIVPVMPFIRMLVNSSLFPGDDFDDCLQEVLVHLFSIIHRASPSRFDFLGWVATVVRHKMATLHRHKTFSDAFFADAPVFSADAEHQESLLPDDLVLSGSSVVPPAAPLTIERDDYPTSYDALMSLSALQRRALLLSAEGWTSADIAREFRISNNSASVLLYRARTAMARALRPAEAAR